MKMKEKISGLMKIRGRTGTALCLTGILLLLSSLTLTGYAETPCQVPNIYFEFDSSALTGQAKEILDSNLDCLTHSEIRIECHTDGQSTEEMSLGIGNRYGSTIKRYLTGKGISSSDITVFSYGSTRPVCAEDTEDCRSRRRFCEFKLTPKEIDEKTEIEEKAEESLAKEMEKSPREPAKKAKKKSVAKMMVMDDADSYAGDMDGEVSGMMMAEPMAMPEAKEKEDSKDKDEPV